MSINPPTSGMGSLMTSIGNNAIKSVSAGTSGTPLPSSLQGTPAPKPPTPSYSGSSIAPASAVASATGSNYNYDPLSGMVIVNGNSVKPTSVTSGSPNVRVADYASAAGHPSTAVHQSGSQATVYPASTQSPQYQQDLSNYGSYNAGVLAQGGAFRDPTAYGETVDQAKQHEAQLYGIDPSLVQVTKGGHTFVPAQYVRQYLDKLNAPQTPAPQPTMPSTPSIVNTPPQAPPPVQIPTFDASSIHPFQFDPTQDFMNQYNAQLPAFQQQLDASGQKINDQMNARGMYNSGVAQQAINQQAQALYGKLFDAIQKNSLADQKQAFQEYQANVTNQLNTFKDNVDAMYKAGQLTNQQYSDEINIWKQQVSFAQDQYNQAMAMQKALIPYTMGPTPAQELPYQYQTANNAADNALKQYLAELPYQMPTAYQQGQLNISQEKLQMQLAQDQVADQQKWAQIMGVGPDGSPTLDMQKLQEQTNKDLQAAKTAATNASNNQVRTQLTALHDQLVAASGFITNLTTQGVKATDPQMTQAISNYNTINAEIKAIADSSGPSDTSSSYSGPLPQPN